MNIFQLIKTVLDEIYYDQLSDYDESTRDLLISNRLEEMHGWYEDLTDPKKREQIDYNDALTRFSYIFHYVTSHANLVYRLICEHGALTEIFDGKNAQVTCLGGGPGSELLGILKFMLLHDKQANLHCYLYDRARAWGESWSDVSDKLQPNFRVDTHVEPIDVTDAKTFEHHSKYFKSDLFTMIYFLSEIYTQASSAEPFLLQLLQRAKPGAVFLYADNKNPHFYCWFDKLVEQVPNIEVLYSDRRNIDMDSGEQRSSLGNYFEKFGSPKLTARIAYRICWKPDFAPPPDDFDLPF